jgi:hypothetical protein
MIEQTAQQEDEWRRRLRAHDFKLMAAGIAVQVVSIA